MFFEELKENYTKVSYKSLIVPEVKFELEMKRKSNTPKLLFMLAIAGAWYFGLDTTVFASTGIDEKANELYLKLLGMAKWIIIGKGGWDTINKMLKEDFEGAKKSFLQYLVIFVILLGFPKALDTVEEVFADV